MLEQKKAFGGVVRPTFVKNLLAISSGKGGVGKTTLTWQLALGLRDRGWRVGILDADIYGPNLLSLAGVHLGDRPSSMHPYMHEGMALMSMALWVDAEKALMWRGPMIARAVVQLMQQTIWPELDVLLVDFPPGTGDIHLSLLGQYAWLGYLLVTTPHPMAIEESRRVCALFEHFQVPQLRSLVNLHHVDCEACGHRMHWLGEAVPQGSLLLGYHASWAQGVRSSKLEDNQWVEVIGAQLEALDPDQPSKRKRIDITVKTKE